MDINQLKDQWQSMGQQPAGARDFVDSKIADKAAVLTRRVCRRYLMKIVLVIAVLQLLPVLHRLVGISWPVLYIYLVAVLIVLVGSVFMFRRIRDRRYLTLPTAEAIKFAKETKVLHMRWNTVSRSVALVAAGGFVADLWHQNADVAIGALVGGIIGVVIGFFADRRQRGDINKIYQLLDETEDE